MNRNNIYEKLFWSIALPDFGQILNGRFLKELLFIALEFLLNVQDDFNEIIVSSLHGEIENASTSEMNYPWLMFTLVSIFVQCGMLTKMDTGSPLRFSAHFTV